ncbi:hypothetical protein BV22DRAFT_118165 [Leucogyrophana mollusca]|uniref:Uncharacterized protein n=1 Tax=Leucogyrophana mollusca TaxID=85980 RepID=A0ACB8BWD1_9AGAM|nr:hypothetical protein BV22DRAFT_118165 [Leucogyrophana mollusca]
MAKPLPRDTVASSVASFGGAVLTFLQVLDHHCACFLTRLFPPYPQSSLHVMPRPSRLDFLRNLEADHIEVAERIRNESAGFETVSISTQKKRAQICSQIERYVADCRGIVPGSSVWTHPNAENLLLDFLTVLVINTAPSPARKAKGHTHVAWKTLKTWHFTIVWAISALVSNGIEILMNGGYGRVYQHVAYLVGHFKLQRVDDPKTFFGALEMRMISEEVYASMVDKELALQMDLCFKLAYNHGVRPSAMGAAYKEFEEGGKYLKHKVDFPS